MNNDFQNKSPFHSPDSQRVRKRKRIVYTHSDDQPSQRYEHKSYGTDGDYRTGGRNVGDKLNYRNARPTRPQNRPPFSSSRPRYEQKNAEEPVRLNKYIANSGICSRREADDYIRAGVVKVNGEVVTEMGIRVKPTDVVYFHDQPLRGEAKVYILLNKPKNTITTTDDPFDRACVLNLVRHACKERIYPVGRLDRNTTGVLLLTNDGDLATKLTHPKFEKKKIYSVLLNKELTPEDEEKLRAGVTLEDGFIQPDAVDFPKDGRKYIGIEIHSGRNRIVRRIFAHLGYKVVALDRVCFAGLTKKNVPRGKYRFLTPKEVSMLQMGAFE